jgi:hypothetical protein
VSYRSLIVVSALVLVALAIVVAPFSVPRFPGSTPPVASASPPKQAQPAHLQLRGESARAARAADRLIAAMRAGDVEALCRPGAILTTAVVDAMNQEGLTCEADVEAELSAARPKGMTLLGITASPDLATARVRSSGGAAVPLTLLRDGRRWLVSFSQGADPISALAG